MESKYLSEIINGELVLHKLNVTLQIPFLRSIVAFFSSSGGEVVLILQDVNSVVVIQDNVDASSIIGICHSSSVISLRHHISKSFPGDVSIFV